MDKQTEIKARIGEVQLGMDSYQTNYNALLQEKQKLTQALYTEMKKPVKVTKKDSKSK